MAYTTANTTASTTAMAYTTAKANTTASTTANQMIPPNNVTFVKHRPAGFAAGKNKYQQVQKDMYNSNYHDTILMME